MIIVKFLNKNFSLYKLDENNKQILSIHEIYYPVSYSEPSNQNIGLNLGSESALNDAINMALETNSLVITKNKQ